MDVHVEVSDEEICRLIGVEVAASDNGIGELWPGERADDGPANAGSSPVNVARGDRGWVGKGADDDRCVGASIVVNGDQSDRQAGHGRIEWVRRFGGSVQI